MTQNSKLSNKHICLFFYLIACTFIPNAWATQRTDVPPKINISPPSVKANSYILIDANSNTVLAQSDENEKVAPASLTKMMTMYVIDNELENKRLDIDDMVHVSSKAWKIEGSRMFLEVNTKVPVREIIKGIIVSSANDGSIAIAEHIAGSETNFADLMNSYAQRLGMNNSHFVNSTGLPHQDHYTTAQDLATLSKAIIHDFPDSYQIYAQKSYKYNKINQYNRNRLLWNNKYVDGIKTGHTDTAGYCFAASAKQNEMRLIAIILGTSNENARINEANKLLNWGFRFYETHKLYSAGQTVKSMPVWYGKKRQLNVGFLNDVYVTIPHGKYTSLTASLHADKYLNAPIQQGNTVGTFSISIDKQTLVEKDLVSLELIEKSGFLMRMKDKVLITFNSTKEKLIS